MNLIQEFLPEMRACYLFESPTRILAMIRTSDNVAKSVLDKDKAKEAGLDHDEMLEMIRANNSVFAAAREFFGAKDKEAINNLSRKDTDYLDQMIKRHYKYADQIRPMSESELDDIALEFDIL